MDCKYDYETTMNYKNYMYDVMGVNQTTHTSEFPELDSNSSEDVEQQNVSKTPRIVKKTTDTKAKRDYLYSIL